MGSADLSILSAILVIAEERSVTRPPIGSAFHPPL